MALVVASMLGTLYSQQPNCPYTNFLLRFICAYEQVFKNIQQVASVFPMARLQGNLNDLDLVRFYCCIILSTLRQLMSWPNF